MAATAVATSARLPALEDLEDIQGILARGYGMLPAARFCLLRVEDGRRARRWLGGLRITPARERPAVEAVNLAVAWEGLSRLGLPETTLEEFPREFREGMATGPRSRLLGDRGESAPAHWRWGRPGEESADGRVDLLLMIYARDDAALSAASARILGEGEEGLAAAGLSRVTALDTHPIGVEKRGGRVLVKEHFGFRDGVGQPQVRSTIPAERAPALFKPSRPENCIAPGEFLLGYEDEYGNLARGPQLPPGEGAGDLAGGGDFGRNGTYLVFRQLEQDVAGFWRFLHARADGDGDRAVALAAKMIGRWPGGAPLVKSPLADDATLREDDEFGYLEKDPDGHRCPFGAHVRRANPRDAMRREGATVETDTSRRHRILRRGRTYGEPFHPDLDPAGMMSAAPDGKSRGLCFIGLNANIGRQFEFIQHNWLNNPKFATLYNDADPLVGHHPPTGGTFTIQDQTLRQRVRGLRRFVRVVGGAYFFMPGLRALQHLAKP